MPKKKKEDLSAKAAAEITVDLPAGQEIEQGVEQEVEQADPGIFSESEPESEQAQETDVTAVALPQEDFSVETTTAGGIFIPSTAAAEDTLLLTEVASEDERPEESLEPATMPEGNAAVKKLLPAVSAKEKSVGRIRKGLHDLNLNELDRHLSAEQQQEWNSIYASFRSKSILTGTAIGVDQYSFDISNRVTQELEKKRLSSLIIIGYRVKILIPESEMWLPGEERPGHVLRNMVGSRVDYVVMDVDREGECAIASRRIALAAKQHFFSRNEHKEGDLLKCCVMAVGAKRCTVECHGYDIHLTQRDLSYTAIADLREKYHPGQEITCLLKEYDAQAGRMRISVKEVNPNPFIGADNRHPVGSRRQAKISGKYAGGVFCTLPDDTVCLCHYSAQHADADFRVGDSVIVLIRRYDYERQLTYGRILAKW